MFYRFGNFLLKHSLHFWCEIYWIDGESIAANMSASERSHIRFIRFQLTQKSKSPENIQFSFHFCWIDRFMNIITKILNWTNVLSACGMRESFILGHNSVFDAFLNGISPIFGIVLVLACHVYVDENNERNTSTEQQKEEREYRIKCKFLFTISHVEWRTPQVPQWNGNYNFLFDLFVSNEFYSFLRHFHEISGELANGIFGAIFVDTNGVACIACSPNVG